MLLVCTGLRTVRPVVLYGLELWLAVVTSSCSSRTLWADGFVAHCGWIIYISSSHLRADQMPGPQLWGQ